MKSQSRHRSSHQWQREGAHSKRMLGFCCIVLALSSVQASVQQQQQRDPAVSTLASSHSTTSQTWSSKLLGWLGGSGTKSAHTDRQDSKHHGSSAQHSKCHGHSSTHRHQRSQRVHRRSMQAVQNVTTATTIYDFIMNNNDLTSMAAIISILDNTTVNMKAILTEPTPTTCLAPINQAFARALLTLNQADQGALLTAGPKPRAARVFLQHVIIGAYPPTSLNDTQTLRSLSGVNITATNTNGVMQFTQGNSTATAVANRTYQIGNSFVIFVDGVLIGTALDAKAPPPPMMAPPPPPPISLYQLVSNDTEMASFMKVIAGASKVINKPNATVLLSDGLPKILIAPINRVVQTIGNSLPPTSFDQILANADTLAGIVLQHIVYGFYPPELLFNNQTFTSVGNTTVRVIRDKGKLMFWAGFGYATVVNSTRTGTSILYYVDNTLGALGLKPAPPPPFPPPDAPPAPPPPALVFPRPPGAEALVTNNTLYDYLNTNPIYSTLIRVIALASTSGYNLTALLLDPTPKTLLAPNNLAVAALYNGLSPALAGQLTASPSALSRIILQHIIPGVYPASTLRNGTQLLSLAGVNVTVITTATSRLPRLQVGNTTVNALTMDQATGTGIVHEIDAALVGTGLDNPLAPLPPLPTVTIWTLIQSNPQLSFVRQGVDVVAKAASSGTTNLTDWQKVFNDPATALTLFAPLDSAVQTQAEGDQFIAFANNAVLIDKILRAHIGTPALAAIKPGDTVTSLAGLDIKAAAGTNGSTVISNPYTIGARITPPTPVTAGRSFFYTVDKILLPIPFAELLAIIFGNSASSVGK